MTARVIDLGVYRKTGKVIEGADTGAADRRVTGWHDCCPVCGEPVDPQATIRRAREIVDGMTTYARQRRTVAGVLNAMEHAELLLATILSHAGGCCAPCERAEWNRLHDAQRAEARSRLAASKKRQARGAARRKGTGGTP
jgi:hypothetical protein